MAIRGRSYVNYPLVRPYNLTLFFDHFGEGHITATAALAGQGQKTASGTATFGAVATFTPVGGEEHDHFVLVGRPKATTIGPPFIGLP